jgi:hypothetical protein
MHDGVLIQIYKYIKQNKRAQCNTMKQMGGHSPQPCKSRSARPPAVYNKGRFFMPLQLVIFEKKH